MTTNIGSHLIQENFASINDDNREEIIDTTKKQVFDLLKKSVRPEFLNRVDEIIMFKPLSREDVKKVVEIQFNIIKDRLAESHIKLEADQEVLTYIAEIGFDPQFGARPLKRVLQKSILNELSKKILDGTISAESLVGITLNDKREIEFINLDEVEI